MKQILALLISTLLGAMALTSCIEDGVTTSPSAQPEFSVSELAMGMYFTGQPTPTKRFTVRNRHDKILNISNITLRGNDGNFRINVDGFAGSTFHNVEIRPNDSIYVFVEATLPENHSPELCEVTEWIDFTTNGVVSSVLLTIEGRDVKRLRGEVVSSDTRFQAEYPYQVYDSLVVAEGATLTIPAGASLHFHDGAYMRVGGRLVTEGTPELPVTMCGDRTDNVVGQISFDLMASQWAGLTFSPQSRGNELSHTEIRNTVDGVTVDNGASVVMTNCRLRNAATQPLATLHADVALYGCEVAEGANGVWFIQGGNVTANHCTFANYYLFAGIRGAALTFDHYNADTATEDFPLMKANFSNCIIYGLGQDLSEGDFTGTEVYLRRCLLKSSGFDDDNFLNCLWDSDPLYYTVREEYIFDYRLREGSPAIGAADPALTAPQAAADFYGEPRGTAPNIGAYQAAGE